MERTGVRAYLYALVVLLSFAAHVDAQTRAAIVRPTGSPAYDLSREVTLNATVSSVLARPSPGMVWGAHLLLRTLTGNVDASLGRFAFAGKGALVVKPGQQVTVTGLMASIHGQPVLLTRIVQVGGTAYVLRSVHGIPMSPTARTRALAKGVLQGGQL